MNIKLRMGLVTFGFVKAFPAETTEAFCDGHNAGSCGYRVVSSV